MTIKTRGEDSSTEPMIISNPVSVGIYIYGFINLLYKLYSSTYHNQLWVSILKYTLQYNYAFVNTVDLENFGVKKSP